MGDSNSRVGRADSLTGDVLGPHGELVKLASGDARPPSGAELVSFCESLGLAVANSFFRHRLCHSLSYQLIGKSELILNDVALVRRDRISSLSDVCVKPGGVNINGGFLFSDHHPLVISVRFKFRRDFSSVRKSTSVDRSILKNDRVTQNRYAERIGRISA